MNSEIKITIVNRDVREEIPVHLFEDYEQESIAMEEMQYLKQLEEEYEWNNFVREGLAA